MQSKGEKECKRVLEKHYSNSERGEYCKFEKYRHPAIRNEITNYPLELDCFNEEHKIAAEYNGIQHYKWPNFTSQSKEEFDKQKNRDQLKRKLCVQENIRLITVPYTVEHEDIETYILDYLSICKLELPSKINIEMIQDFIEMTKLDDKLVKKEIKNIIKFLRTIYLLTKTYKDKGWILDLACSLNSNRSPKVDGAEQSSTESIYDEEVIKKMIKKGVFVNIKSNDCVIINLLNDLDDPINKFITDRLDILDFDSGDKKSEKRSQARTLYEAYKVWCSDTSENPISEVFFGKKMTKRFLNRKRKISGKSHYLGIVSKEF